MRISPKAAAMSAALVWGGYGMFLAGLTNLIAPPYAEHFLLTMSSVYPGYHASRTIADLLVGSAYGMLDAGVAGLLFAWLYNRLIGSPAQSS